jgi:hypothetical protein
VKDYCWSIPVNDPVLIPVMKKFGWEGYGKFQAVLQYCIKWEYFDLDEDAITLSTGSNVRGARTLLPLFKDAIETILTTYKIPNENKRQISNWLKLRQFVFERDSYTCQYCGKKDKKLECDHIVPVSRGGGHDISNLKTACFECNRSKGSKTLSEWRKN